MTALEKKAYEVACAARKTIKSFMVFPSTGTSEEKAFDAVIKAEKYVVENGYQYGSMCGDMPIAIANDSVEYIAKWRNIDPSEYSKMHGVMVCNPDFRNGDVGVAIFN